MALIGKLTKKKTVHRVGPPASEIFAEGNPKNLMFPLALVDGSVWGSKTPVPFVYCEYTDSSETGLRFKRNKKGLLELDGESRKRLAAWEAELKGMDIEVEVDPKP